MGWLFHACFTEVCEQLRSGAAARPLSRVLNPLVAKLVAFSKVGEGDLVHMLGGTLVFAFVAPQAVGGDMLFGRRVGFSGTPSDLLPVELGQCDYETGDDGKMLSTVLDPGIMGCETLGAGWGVDDVLDRVAQVRSSSLFFFNHCHFPSKVNVQ